MHRGKNIVIGITIGLVLILSITVSTAWAQKDIEKRERKGGERIIHFVHTGAINGYIEPPDGFGGWAAIAGFVDSLGKEGETVFLLDAGDGQWGSGAALVTGGETPARLANAANYDAILLGNLDVYSSSLELLNMPLIRGNSDFYKAYGAIPSAVPFTIIKKSGISVGIIGALYGPPDKKNPYEEHRKIVRRMKREKVDVVVLLAHDARGRDWNKYKKMGVDVVLAHWSQFGPPSKAELIENTGMAISYTMGVFKGDNLGHLKLKVRKNKFPTKLIRRSSPLVVLSEEQIILDRNRVRMDEKVNRIAQQEKLRVGRILDETVGEAAENVSHSLGRSSPAGELVLNAIKESTDAEIVIYNSPGIRDGLKKGIIKYSDLVDMLPFGNRIVTFELRGKDLQEFARSYNRNVLASGIEFGKVVKVNNKPLDPERYYLVTSNEYLLQHGTGPFKILKKGSNKIYCGYVIKALCDYVRKNSPIKIETAFKTREKEAITPPVISWTQEAPIPKKTLEDYKMLGEIYQRQGKSREAFQLYQEAQDKFPEKFLEFQMAIARIYKKEKYFPQALVTYQQIINEHPESKWAPRAQWEIAEIIGHRLGNYEKAFNEYQRLIDNYPQSRQVADALLGIGECYEYKGEYKKALAKYQEIIERYPRSGADYDAELKVDAITKGDDYKGEPLRLYTLEYKLWKEGKYQESIGVCRELVSRYPKAHLASSVQYYIGYIYQFELKDYEQAIKEYQRVLEKYPKSHRASFAQYRIGECYKDLERYDLAEEAFEKVLKEYPATLPARWIKWRQ
ncbi:tetratricopeptide repeat protein [bacterium]|nr:tetratricopeptide repeat protein [bacterium]MBU4560772.1 tetratricopeptide repeat protein [bacterium]MCG2676059.1 tetratricopeptide repeat protein [bacterium]